MSREVNVTVKADKAIGTQEHSWRFIGYDECNYTYIPEGVELLNKFAALGDAPYYVRTHFMFCTGNCHGTYKFGSTNIYWENENGEAAYDFTWYDKIMDAILDSGNKPFVELGFMPKALADTNYLVPVKGNWEGYEQYKQVGWTCPPKDYQKWHDFIKAVMEHLVARYGQEEAESWYYELWNEPDIFYWKATAAEYCKLYDYTEHAVHGVSAKLRLSGPAVTGIFEGQRAQGFFRFFLNHCRNGCNYYTQEQGTALDFITFHVKGGGFPFEMNAAKNVPSVESLANQVKLGLDCIVEYGYEGCEVVLSEADPDGWAAGGVYDNANMVFRNTEYYATYVASTYEKIEQLCRKYRMVVRPLAWAFMFPGERCFEGTRAFTTQGIDKAVFNMFKVYGGLGKESLEFASDGAFNLDFLGKAEYGVKVDGQYTGEGEAVDVSGFAVRGDAGEIQIVVYSHCNDRDKQERQDVRLKVSGLKVPGAVCSGPTVLGTGQQAEVAQQTQVRQQVQVAHYRIDGNHSNPYAEWVRQGRPLFPVGEQYAAIKARDGLEKFCEDFTAVALDGQVEIGFEMPAHGVSYLVIR